MVTVVVGTTGVEFLALVPLPAAAAEESPTPGTGDKNTAGGGARTFITDIGLSTFELASIIAVFTEVWLPPF